MGGGEGMMAMLAGPLAGLLGGGAVASMFGRGGDAGAGLADEVWPEQDAGSAVGGCGGA